MVMMRVVGLGALLCATLGTSYAVTLLGDVRVSPDSPVDLAGTLVGPQNVAQDDLDGVVTLGNLGALPGTSKVTGYHRFPNGDQLFALDIPVDLPGNVPADPGDLVLYDGAMYAVFFDASANGIPAGTLTDAVTAVSVSDLLLSFDVPVAFAGFTADPGDLVRFHNGSPTLFFDASAEGIPEGTNLDAADCLVASGHLLLSFDVPGLVGGVNFDPEDVLEFTPGSATWEMAYDGSMEHAGWSGGDLDALQATTDPPGVPVAPQIDAGSNGVPGSQRVLAPGTSRVTGAGTPRGKPDDMCIQIFAVGPDGISGTPDDELLATGGTDAEGKFVDAAEMLGIGLSHPLVPGDQVFALDVCSGLRGATVAVTTPAPALSPLSLVIAIGALFWVARRKLRY
jgi:hypothetical protein